MKIIQLEILFLLLAAAITACVLLPLRHVGVDFPFSGYNAVLILVSVIWFKHIFLLKYSLIDRWQKVKIALIPLSIPLIAVLIRMLGQFITFINEMPLADLMPHLWYERQHALASYIRTEYLIFSATAIAGAVLLPIRLLISIWKEVNKKGG